MPDRPEHPASHYPQYFPLCSCCKLPQPQAIDKATGVSAPVCAGCTHHQGDQTAMRLRRAESHERMCRERLDACRASEAAARKEHRAAADDAANARRATAAALASRGRLAKRIVDAAASSPGSHRCPSMDLANDPDVVRWARRAAQDLDDLDGLDLTPGRW